MFDAMTASRRYPCVLIVFWRLATKVCPLRASLARLFAFCVTGPSWPPLAVFLANRGAKRDRAVQERGRRHVLCVRARNGQGQAPHMGANGTHMAFKSFLGDLWQRDGTRGCNGRRDRTNERRNKRLILRRNEREKERDVTRECNETRDGTKEGTRD